MRIDNEFDLALFGTVYVTCDARIKKDRYGDPELVIDNLKVDGRKPTEAMTEKVYELLERDYWDTILEDEPSYEDLKSLHDEARFDEWYQSDRYRRAI